MQSLAVYERGQTIATPMEHYRLLHPQQRGVVIALEQSNARGSSPGNWHKLRADDHHTSELRLAALAHKKNAFITPNEFYGWRRVGLTNRLCACWVDIDNFTDLDGALDGVMAAKLPQPSFIMRSGTGLHLYWLLDSMPPETLGTWQRVQNAIISGLAEQIGVAQRGKNRGGVDRCARDAARIMRLAGSIHSGTNRVVTGEIITGERWTLHELANEVLGYRKPGWQRTTRHSKSRRISFSAEKVRRQGLLLPHHRGIISWWSVVYQDLLWIARSQPNGKIAEGHRDNWLFIATVAASWFAEAEALRDESLWLAREFTTLDLSAAQRHMASTIERAERAAAGEKLEWGNEQRDPRYYFRRNTIRDFLRPLISDESQLRAIISDELRAERRRLSKRTGKQPLRQNAPIECRHRASELAQSGVPVSTIADLLGYPRSTVSGWLQRISK